MIEKTVEADGLCVGCGIAGLMGNRGTTMMKIRQCPQTGCEH